MSAGTGVELSGRPLLRALQFGIGVVKQLRPIHDGEVPG